MLCHPSYWVRKPPIGGPRKKPKYAPADDHPSAYPLLSGGKTENIIAEMLLNIMEAPIPWMTLKNNRISAEVERPANIEERVMVMTPHWNTFILP